MVQPTSIPMMAQTLTEKNNLTEMSQKKFNFKQEEVDIMKRS